MPRPSFATVTLIVLWIGYALVTTYVFYDSIEPVKRELVDILGAFTLFLIIVTAIGFYVQRRKVSADDQGPRSSP